jgi:DNA-binding transcriptional LysR family regulator
MELRQLESFVRIAALGSFTRAAEELALSQPAVTRQISLLEREVKTRLFDRLGRHIALTAAGDALHGYALEILRQMEEAKRAVADVSSGVAGRLTVGASSTAATYLLPPILRQYHESYPAVDLNIHTGLSARIAELVLKNEVDLGVVMGDHEGPGLTTIPIAESATVVVVYPDHPLVNKGERGISAEELKGSALILMEEGTNLRRYVDRLLSTAAVKEQVSLELDNVEAIKKMIEARLGISLLPLMAVESEIADRRLIALSLADVPGASRPVTVIHRTDKYLSTALKAFIRLTRKAQAVEHTVPLT